MLTQVIRSKNYNIIMQEITGFIKATQCRRMEEVKGQELEILNN